METYSLIQRNEPVSPTLPPQKDDIFEDIIHECEHPEEARDNINFFCHQCGVSFEPGFASLSCSSGLQQGFFCHSYVNSINDRFSRFPKQKIKTVRTAKTVSPSSDETSKKEEIPLADLIEIQRKEIEDKFENKSIPFIEKMGKIERGKKATSAHKDTDLIKHLVHECFSSDKTTFTNLLNGYAIYNTGKRKLAEPCPLSKFVSDSKFALVQNWDSFIKKIEFLYHEYNELIVAMTPSNKRNRSKIHIEIYVVLLAYHILQFHLEKDEFGAPEINVCTLNDCFDLNRITVTKMRPSNPKSKVKTVICGLADRLGVGNSSLPRLITESIGFSLKLLKNPRFAEYQRLQYV